MADAGRSSKWLAADRGNSSGILPPPESGFVNKDTFVRRQIIYFDLSGYQALDLWNSSKKYEWDYAEKCAKVWIDMSKADSVRIYRELQSSP